MEWQVNGNSSIICHVFLEHMSFQTHFSVVKNHPRLQCLCWKDKNPSLLSRTNAFGLSLNNWLYDRLHSFGSCARKQVLGGGRAVLCTFRFLEYKPFNTQSAGVVSVALLFWKTSEGERIKCPHCQSSPPLPSQAHSSTVSPGETFPPSLLVECTSEDAENGIISSDMLKMTWENLRWASLPFPVWGNPCFSACAAETRELCQI